MTTWVTNECIGLDYFGRPIYRNIEAEMYHEGRTQAQKLAEKLWKQEAQVEGPIKIEGKTVYLVVV